MRGKKPPSSPPPAPLPRLLVYFHECSGCFSAPEAATRFAVRDSHRAEGPVRRRGGTIDGADRSERQGALAVGGSLKVWRDAQRRAAQNQTPATSEVDRTGQLESGPNCDFDSNKSSTCAVCIE